jgi:serine phosphatase RsbU (regulator of sigma subunit)
MKATGRSFSVLTKLILSVSLLVALVVGMMATFDLMAMLKLYDQTAKQQEESRTAAMRREGSAVARKLAVSLAPALAESNYSLLQEVLDATTQGDKLILEALVADESGTAVVRSGMKTLPSKVQLQAKDGKTPEPIHVKDQRVHALRFVAPLSYGGAVRGEVWMNFSLSELDQMLLDIRKQREDAAGKSVTRSLLVGALCLLVGLVLAIGQGLQVARPVRELAEKATHIAQGDLSARVVLKSRDEFGRLGGTFNHMAERIQELLKETADKIQLRNEMEIARTVQDRLVPSAEVVVRENLRLVGYYDPASICGGDFWNYFNLGPTKTLVVIADVTGHGVSSALLTAAAKSCCDTLQTTHGEHITVLQLMQTLNMVIYRAGQRHLQMTCFATIIDHETNTISFASAGHQMPYLCRLKDDRYSILTLLARGNRLGDMLDWHFPVFNADIQSGDVLLWFTDGIVEAENALNEAWGDKRLRRTLLQAAHGLPEQIRDTVVKTAYEFFGGRAPADDITLVVGKIG